MGGGGGKRERWKDKASLCQEGTARWLRLMAREVRKRGQEGGRREEEAGGPEREREQGESPTYRHQMVNYKAGEGGGGGREREREREGGGWGAPDSV